MKFKVGDRVKIKEEHRCYNCQDGVGTINKIIEEGSTYPILVKLDKPGGISTIEMFSEKALTLLNSDYTII